jgi:hypothetical protein
MVLYRLSGRKKNKKFWEELITYLSINVILVSDTTNRKKTLVSMRIEMNKIIQFGGLHCWYYWWKWIIGHIVQMASDDMIYSYLPSFMKIGLDNQVIIRLLPRYSERLQCLHYWWERFLKMPFHMTSGGMMYITSLMMIGSVIQKLLEEDTHTDTQTAKWSHKLAFIFSK